MSMVEVIFTTNPGIEDIAADEISAKLGARIIDIRKGLGRVVATVPRDSIELIETLRSIHRARILVSRGKVCAEQQCLNGLKKVVTHPDLTKYITPLTSFAIRAERSGLHEYTSLDIARVAGDAVIELVSKAFSERPPVDLDYPSIIVAVDVINEDVLVSIELGGDLSWHRRGYRIYDHPAALKPTLAYAMLVLSGARDGDVILDPMCGGGTVAIEAAYLFEDSEIICMDKNPRHIRGAKLNAKAAQVYQRIRFIVGDARKLSSYIDEADVVVSNPPYGIRLGSPHEVRRVYRDFLQEAVSVVRKSIALITTEHIVVKEVVSKNRWRIVEDRIVSHGNLHPHIIVASPQQ
ncbi:tRNA (guanine(6)-N2)-methyltransferase [Pyrofollis japonicus]|uniref:methyltransferase domain-containing protein n=1 Tax=Pyrofollis japonicus TaxID=3060460 RepID=UPI00295BBFFD|nr:THUMP domain-containing protein [Pyrofollis japonicus]BEP18121.1 tRNA (guanine(6)-N2)-methyltransferase [Pyrofollis japonicus]